jgi:hypothetical protein
VIFLRLYVFSTEFVNPPVQLMNFEGIRDYGERKFNERFVEKKNIVSEFEPRFDLLLIDSDLEKYLGFS